jgi:hypothetical protein
MPHMLGVTPINQADALKPATLYCRIGVARM